MEETFSGIDEKSARRIKPDLGEAIILQDEKGENVVAIHLGGKGGISGSNPVVVNLEFPQGHLAEVRHQEVGKIMLQGYDIRGVQFK